MHIYKIVTADQWNEWAVAGQWSGAPIDLSDGYIHMSTRGQVQKTVDLYFTGRDDLVLVAFDTSTFGDHLKWEASRGGDLFPHIYRTIEAREAAWSKPVGLTQGQPVIDWDGGPRTRLDDLASNAGGGWRKAIDGLGLKAVRALDPEKAHGVALKALHTPAVHLPGALTSDRLETTLAGLDLPNPLGLAAGFDKNAESCNPLQRAGFGFIEVGAATPRPQPGNPKPRLFRLTEDRAVINRFGFNNEGMDAIAGRLRDRDRSIPVGLNLGANKDSADRADDYVQVLRTCGPLVDFVTVNVSSPNTEKLRDLQGSAALRALLENVLRARDADGIATKVMVKIAPDLTDDEIADVASIANDLKGLDAIIATNTTLGRDGLKSTHKDEAGGLSGAPLFDLSTRVLARLATLTNKPLIGVGGVSSASQAYAKIKAGASAVQLYSGLVYGGLGLVTDIVRDLDALVQADGYANIGQAVGKEKEAWL